MTIKEKLQKLLNNIDEDKLKNTFVIKEFNTSMYDMVKMYLSNCQKEPSLHDKLIEYCKLNVNSYRSGSYCGEHGYNHTFTIWDSLKIHLSNESSTVLVEYEPNEIICNSHEQVFDAIKLFEKWSQE